jgi:malonyl-CoA/methylmalonyl-CoA synthetase
MVSLSDWFASTASKQAEKEAIVFLRDGKIETRISYGELDVDSNRVANALINLGVERGDRVILLLPKSLIFVVAYLAIQKLGAIAVPLDQGLKKSEMEYLIKNVDPKLVLSETAQGQIIHELDPGLNNLVIQTQERYQNLSFFRSASKKLSPVEIGPDDPALIIFTSGTTGKPKGAILTQNNLVHDAKNILKIWEIDDSDTLCHALPLSHVHGLCFALQTALMAGSRIIMLNQFSPETVIDILSKKKGEHVCTLFMAVPSMYTKMMQVLGEKVLDFRHIRLWASGSAPLLVKDFERMRHTFGKEPVEREGMSETGMNFSNPLRGKRKPGSIGLPLPGLRVRIVDPETRQGLAPGQVGEIWLKGPNVTPGYWRKPEETATAFEQGWFRTGDLAKMDGEGYYYITDRIKHIIISGGENVSPKEIETVINQLPNVIESSVVGIPDEKWGERVVAAIVPKSNVSLKPEDIRNFCKKHLHDWKCPKEVVFLEALPKNTMGKVLKEEVKGAIESRIKVGFMSS